MGNLFHFTIKILSLAAQAVIVSLNSHPAEVPSIAKIPDPILSQPAADRFGNEFRVFETEHGTITLYGSSRDILP